MAPVFTADGRRILFTAALHPDADSNLVSDVYVLEPGPVSEPGKAPAPVRLTNTGGGPLLGASSPVPSADGKWLYFLGSELSDSGTDFVARNSALYVVPAGVPADAAGPHDQQDRQHRRAGLPIPTPT